MIDFSDHKSLKIGIGEFTCLIGPNGAGKSTPLKIAGLLRPQRGIVRFEGKVKERDIGYLPQSPSFAPHLTVFEAVLTVECSILIFPRMKMI
ncbi:MAG: ABC transporter ATP-binding protein [Archaeoglobaceae archaeon]